MVIVIQLGGRTDRKVRASGLSDAVLTARSSAHTAWVSSMCEWGSPTRRGPGPEAWARGAQINSLITT